MRAYTASLRQGKVSIKGMKSNMLHLRSPDQWFEEMAIPNITASNKGDQVGIHIAKLGQLTYGMKTSFEMFYLKIERS